MIRLSCFSREQRREARTKNGKTTRTAQRSAIKRLTERLYVLYDVNRDHQMTICLMKVLLVSARKRMQEIDCCQEQSCIAKIVRVNSLKQLAVSP